MALVQMMENAGRNLAHLARGRYLGDDARVTTPASGRFSFSPEAGRTAEAARPARAGCTTGVPMS